MSTETKLDLYLNQEIVQRSDVS